MATYDLEQQEQLDQVKHFWNKYGNLITWLLVLVLGGYAAWMGYNYWQQKRAMAAGGLYEELDRAATESKPDKVEQAFADLKANYAGTTFAEQGALLAAKVASDQGKADKAKVELQWLVDSGKNANLVSVARLRLAGMQMDDKQYEEAFKTLSTEIVPEFAPLAADRRGDILLAQGKKDDAAKAYLEAWNGLDASVEYRRFIEGKLTSLGQSPTPSNNTVSSTHPGVAAGLPSGGIAPTSK